MKQFLGQAINSATGNPIPGPSITVRHRGQSTPLAVIYSDEGITAKSNPFLGDSVGRFGFYAPDGDYDCEISATGVATYTITDLTIVDEKRVTQVTLNDDVYLLMNAFYRRSGTPGFDRIDTTKVAMAFVLDRGLGRARILYAAPGANPIIWAEMIRFGHPTATVQFFDLVAAAAGASPEVLVVGPGANIGMILRPKGTAQVEIGANALKLIGGTGGGLQFGASSPIINHHSATVTWDPISLAAGAQTTTTITLAGSVLGDEVTVSFSLDLQGLQLTGYVSTAGTITVVLQNGTAGTVDLGSGTLRASIWRH